MKLLHFSKRTVLQSLMGGGLALLAAQAMADDSLWGEPAQQAQVEVTRQKPAKGGVSSIGVHIGNYVTFKGVGTVFYAGWAEGDVYFADTDEPGGFTWENAIGACHGRGEGWTLPSLDQLNLLYINSVDIDLIAAGIEPTSGNWYWSASPYDSVSAWRERFYDGHQQPIKKHFAARVRCVRVY